MQVEQVMSRQVRTCTERDTLAVAAGLMWDHDIGALPVLGTDGKLAGVITDRDICMGALFSGRPLTEIPVGEHMSRQVFTVEPAATVEAAEQLMADKQIRRLPVVGFEGELIGMLTMSDLTRAAVEPDRKEVGAREVATTLSRIVRARRPAVGAA